MKHDEGRCTIILPHRGKSWLFVVVIVVVVVVLAVVVIGIDVIVVGVSVISVIVIVVLITAAVAENCRFLVYLSERSSVVVERIY